MKRKFKCRDCEKPCVLDGGRCAKCFRLYLKEKRAQRFAVNNKGNCIDCQAQCGTNATRCKKCSATYRKGKTQPMEKRVVVPTDSTFTEWLRSRDFMLYKMLQKLGQENREYYERALKGILENIRAQKLNAQKSKLSLRIDIDPIREILTDAKVGKFYFEEDLGFCPTQSLYRFEVYYTV